VYESLIRQWSTTDEAMGPEAVSHHRGDSRAFLRRCEAVIHKALQEGPAGVRQLAPYLLGWVADPRTLRCAWDDLARHGGQAPGPNGHRYHELDDHEVWALCRCLGRAIREGSYRPGGEKVRWIPKGPGRGERPLIIQNIEDRVVQRAVVLIVQQLLDPLFDAHSLGFRPDKGRLDALAMAERYFVKEKRRVWVTEDIKDAFLNVPLPRLMQVVQKYLVADDLAELIGRILGGARTPGLRQGGPLSPWLLNLYLHHSLDRAWRKRHSDIPLIRVADDILLLSRTMKQAKHAHATLTSLLTASGMPAKLGFPTAAHRLTAGETADWLGFRIGRDEEGLVVGVGKRAWERLDDKLKQAHDEPNSPARADAIIRGWVDQMGPCFPHVDRDEFCDRIRAAAHAQAFDEIPSRTELKQMWQRAFARWGKVRAKAKLAPATT
jgi:retron-type reverse transcriptase